MTNVIFKSLYITDTKLPGLEELFSLWDEGYEVWIVNAELERQLRLCWEYMLDEPQPWRRVTPKLIVVDM